MYVEVLLELKNKQTDQTYTYKVPDSLEDLVSVGKRVKVPFNHRELEGFILSISDFYDKEYKIAEIINVVDEDVILNEELLNIGKFIKETYLCSLSSSYATMLPKALKASEKTNINKKYKSNLFLNIDYEAALKKCSNNKQKEIIDFIYENDGVEKKEANLISTSSVITLLKKEIIREEQEEMYRLNSMSVLNDTKKGCNLYIPI